MTVREAIRRGQEDLKDISDTPELDARWLLSHALRRSDTWLSAYYDTAVSLRQRWQFRRLVRARALGQPLAYLLGEWEFYGRRFMVTPAVLIPRPMTEELIDQSQSVIRALAARIRRPLIVADIGTGSGCIGITLLLENPAEVKKVYATDISAEALAVAQRNAVQHGVARQIEFLRGDMLSALSAQPVDLIVSNPPYLSADELLSAGTTKETAGLLFEPYSALVSTQSGRTHVEAIAASGIPAVVETASGITTYSV